MEHQIFYYVLQFWKTSSVMNDLVFPVKESNTLEAKPTIFSMYLRRRAKTYRSSFFNKKIYFLMYGSNACNQKKSDWTIFWK